MILEDWRMWMSISGVAASIIGALGIAKYKQQDHEKRISKVEENCFNRPDVCFKKMDDTFSDIKTQLKDIRAEHSEHMLKIASHMGAVSQYMKSHDK